MHAIEKILARAASVKTVHKGDVLDVNVDVALTHDRSGAKVASIFTLEGFSRVKHPDRFVIVFDHNVPPTNLGSAENKKMFRDFIKAHGLQNFYDFGEGISHQVIAEKGYVVPGSIVIGTDSHTTTAGALGALATAVGAKDMVSALVTGTIWLQVPGIVRFELTGELQEGVMAKDIIISLIGMVGIDGGVYKAVEFAGPAIKHLSIDSRMVLSNMSVEMGAKFGFIEADDRVAQWLSGRSRRDYVIEKSDPDVDYEWTREVCLDELEPLVSKPHSIDNAAKVSDVEGMAIDQAVIGSCTGGRLEDLRAAAGILRGRTVHPGTRLIVTPASRSIYLAALEEGLIEVFLTAGATVNPPRCGPCGSACDGLLGSGERCITTACLNFKGRLGSPESEVFLASPLTVAASAVNGKITDPRRYL